MQEVPFSVLIGKTIQKIDGLMDSLFFFVSEEESYKMYHAQDCCESVQIEDICGELDWLIGTPILQAEERTNSSDRRLGESFTWTFYEISTIKGSVTIRWYGCSNGYYSESVDFVRLN